jgi:hypothetical protein
MSYKPSDFFIDIVDLLGIIAPGAIFLFLHHEDLASWVGVRPPEDPAARWIGFFVVSYVIGHILSGLGEPLNWLAARLFRRNDAFFSATMKTLSLPTGLAPTRANAFYQIVAILRLRNPALLVEVEHAMAEYKLFRGLTAALVLHFLIIVFIHPAAPTAIVTAVILLGAVAFRFFALIQWAYRSTFNLYVNLPTMEVAPTKE